MWYSTNFSGKIRFNRELSGSELQALQSVCNDYIPEIKGYANIEIHPFHLEWNWWKKTYRIEEWIQFLIKEYFIKWNIIINWKLEAQWEEIWDRRSLIIEDNIFSHIEKWQDSIYKIIEEMSIYADIYSYEEIKNILLKYI